MGFVYNFFPFALINTKLCLKWPYKLLTDHIFDCTGRIIDCINKSFWQKSFALNTWSFCIQLKNCSSFESWENWQNVATIKVDILSMDICICFNVLLFLLIVSRSQSTLLILTLPYCIQYDFKRFYNNCPGCVLWFKQNVCFISPWTDLRSQKSSVRKVDKTSAHSIELPL